MEDHAVAKVYETTYIAELDGKFVGKIGLERERDDGYIFGFSILPEYRGRGYGRELLSWALRTFKSENAKGVCLEVAVQNENALTLYKTCGFRVVSVYNYFKILLV